MPAASSSRFTDDPPVAPADPRALRHLPSHLRLWIMVVAGVAADLWSKDWAFRTLEWNQSRVIVGNVLNFQLSLNPGALFGIGHGWAPIFVGASVLALLFVLYLFAHSDRRRWSLHLALGMVLAGALGNLYDRAFKSAYVVYEPGQGRDIGTLFSENDRTVTLTDFETARNPRTHLRPDNARSGPQPVVRDFISLEIAVGRFRLWPWIFNIADALLVVGVGMLLLNFWAERKHHARADARHAPAD